MNRQEFFRYIHNSIVGHSQPAPPTPEERLLAAIFPTVENHPWPEEVQPMPGVKWRDDQDDYDWACYVAECINARSSTALGVAQVVFSVLLDGERRAEQEKDPALLAVLNDARLRIQSHLDMLEGFTT